jgi:C1A family cysteine protease
MKLLVALAVIGSIAAAFYLTQDPVSSMDSQF